LQEEVVIEDETNLIENLTPGHELAIEGPFSNDHSINEVFDHEEMGEQSFDEDYPPLFYHEDLKIEDLAGS